MNQASYYARDAFLSYSTQDKLTADAICATLERDKVRCWIAPRDVLPGVSYAEAIIDGINSSRLLVVVLSSASNGSPQVLREVERAVSKGIPVIPFRIEDVVPSKSMEYFLSAPHWLDALTKPLEAHIERLSTVVRAVLDPERQSAVGDHTSGSYGAASSRTAESAQRALIDAAVQVVSFVRRMLSRAPRRALRAGLGITAVVVALIACSSLFSTDQLNTDFSEYRSNVVTGRGSVVFLRRVAPLRYSDWRARAESGNPIAQLFIGRCYQEGLVVSEDAPAAIPWLEKSAGQGNSFAMHTLGLAFEIGKGVAQDRAKALQWYTRAAESGNTVSMRAAGELYKSGVSSKPEPELAFSWYRKAADAGDPVAMRLVGDCFQYGTGVTKDATEGARWHERAANAGDAYTVGKNFGDRLAPHFAAYLAADASSAKKASSLSALQDLKRQYEGLDFAPVSAMFSASEIGSATNGLQDLGPDDPLRILHDDLTKRYMELYAGASRSERVANISSFSLATETLLDRWYSDRRYDDVVKFWERSYEDIPGSDITPGGEFNALIRQMNWAISSLMRTGKRKEAADVLQLALELCDRNLQVQPWDWYLKNAYSGLCFGTASTWVEMGEPANAQPLLRRGWSVFLKQYGKEALLDRYSELPLKGKVPPGASDADREFFERFASGADKAKSGIKRFTIPCDFAGKKYPFQVYVLTGPRGYAELLDQFRWLNDVRGGEVPAEVRESFLKLNQIAVENKTDFMELCVYALGAAPTEKPEDKSKDAAKD